MRHLLLNQVIPITLTHLGALVLHASACMTPEGSVAFMGRTGAGKSTLAASFGLRGFEVLTDDCMLVEKQDDHAVTVPSYAGVRLWPDTITALCDRDVAPEPLAHYTEKKRLVFEQGDGTASFKLAAIFVLTQAHSRQKGNGISIHPLAPSDALLEIAANTFYFDTSDHRRLERAFRQYEWAARNIPFFSLNFPRDYAALTRVHKAVLDHLDIVSSRQHCLKLEQRIVEIHNERTVYDQPCPH